MGEQWQVAFVGARNAAETVRRTGLPRATLRQFVRGAAQCTFAEHCIDASTQLLAGVPLRLVIVDPERANLAESISDIWRHCGGRVHWVTHAELQAPGVRPALDWYTRYAPRTLNQVAAKGRWVTELSAHLHTRTTCSPSGWPPRALVLHGASGSGKSTAIRLWCAQNQVQLNEVDADSCVGDARHALVADASARYVLRNPPGARVLALDVDLAHGADVALDVLKAMARTESQGFATRTAVVVCTRHWYERTLMTRWGRGRYADRFWRVAVLPVDDVLSALHPTVPTALWQRCGNHNLPSCARESGDLRGTLLQMQWQALLPPSSSAAKTTTPPPLNIAVLGGDVNVATRAGYELRDALFASLKADNSLSSVMDALRAQMPRQRLFTEAMNFVPRDTDVDDLSTFADALAAADVAQSCPNVVADSLLGEVAAVNLVVAAQHTDVRQRQTRGGGGWAGKELHFATAKRTESAQRALARLLWCSRTQKTGIDVPPDDDFLEKICGGGGNSLDDLHFVQVAAARVTHSRAPIHTALSEFGWRRVHEWKLLERVLFSNDTPRLKQDGALTELPRAVAAEPIKARTLKRRAVTANKPREIVRQPAPKRSKLTFLQRYLQQT